MRCPGHFTVDLYTEICVSVGLGQWAVPDGIDELADLALDGYAYDKALQRGLDRLAQNV